MQLEAEPWVPDAGKLEVTWAGTVSALPALSGVCLVPGAAVWLEGWGQLQETRRGPYRSWWKSLSPINQRLEPVN